MLILQETQLHQKSSRLPPIFERLHISPAARSEKSRSLGHQNPNLYHAKTTVYFNGEIQDKYLTRFGIRDIQLTADEGLLLNGKKVFAQGGNIHHDLGCVGAVALKSGYRYRLQKLKEMGCNSLRLSHNPHAPVLLDLCDEMGILVISEAYDKWTSQYYGGEVPFKKSLERRLGKVYKKRPKSSLGLPMECW